MDREDFTSLRVFFDVVKRQVPNAEVTHVMTDDGKS